MKNQGIREIVLLSLGSSLLAAALGGCGYTLQTSASPALDQEGVRRVYVSPVINNSYKSGVENLVYNALLRSLSNNRRLELVRDPEAADAVLQGTVTLAFFSPSASVTGDKLNPVGVGGRFASVQVATEYTSTLACSFALTRRNPTPERKPVVWSASFSRGKPFPASNQLGTLGETSSLINESAFDRSLGEMAQSIAGDVRESMISRF